MTVKPIFDMPVRHFQPPIFDHPAYWSKQSATFDGVWSIEVLGTYGIAIQLTSFSTAGNNNRFEVYDMTDLNNIHIVGTANVADPNPSTVCWINPNLACYAAGGIRFVNVANKTNPILGNATPGVSNASFFLYPGTGTILYVSCANQLTVVDFSNINATTAASVTQDFDTADRQAMAYNPATSRLYSFGSGTNGQPANNPADLVVCNVANPAAPTKVNAIYGRPLYSGVRSALLWDTNTIVANCSTYGVMLVIDISSPDVPEITRAFEYRNLAAFSNIDTRIIGRRGNDVLLHEGILSSQARIWRIDCSDLSNMVVVDRFDGDFDTGSPLAFTQPSRNVFPGSGDRLWGGLYPVVCAPALDKITVVNI